MPLKNRFKSAWNAFNNRAPTPSYNNGALTDVSMVSYNPSRTITKNSADKSIVTSIINRIAVDVSQTSIRHVRLDENGRYLEDIKSGLNECLTVEANIDQSHTDFFRDIVISLCDEGQIAVVPIDTDDDVLNSNTFDIHSLRVARITAWRPRAVEVECYNDMTGQKQRLVFPKESVCIIENPMYSIMNEPNGTMQRLMKKLNMLDGIDEQTSAGKLDLIIQLPYALKSEARRQQAAERKEDIVKQLSNSKYGIAYVDNTEKITQLNRPLENNLLKQIEYLTEQLYSQLGITKEVLLGTADEKTMINFQNRTIVPFVNAIVNEMRRKFLTKTARTQGQEIMAFKDAFKLVPMETFAELADKLTRNEIMTSNEIRQIIGLKPSDDPKADMLINSNISQDSDMMNDQYGYGEPEEYEE